MTEINRYITNQRTHIDALKQYELKGYINNLGKPATWDDPVWQFKNNNGQKSNYYFTNNSVIKGNFNSHYSPSQILPDNLRHLLMAYTITVNAGSDSIGVKTAKQSMIKRFLGCLGGNPAHFDAAEIDACIVDNDIKHQIYTFFDWLRDQFFISPSLRLSQLKYEEIRKGGDIIENKKNKIPETKILLALGAIFHDVIPPEIEKWDIKPLSPQRDAFACTMTALALSSANRIDAEQTVLAKQELKQITQTVNDSETLVNYLDWQGSKGFSNSHNHILSVMATPVDRALKYINITCATGRTLARFYETPTMPLKKLLGDYKPLTDNLKALNPDMSKPINLVCLGYLLGFFEQGAEMVRVSKNTRGALLLSDTPRGSIFHKAITDLTLHDELIFKNSCHLTNYLLGFFVKKTALLSIFGGEKMTVAHFQQCWIQHIYNNITGFPMGYNKTIGGKCRYKDALFCFTGKQFWASNSAPYIGSTSHFSLVALSALGDAFSQEVRGRISKDNLFSRHGFSDDFTIKPHQFRHWLDDIAEREGVPHAVINLWSGRKSPEQLLHYVHRTHAEKASEVSDIIFNEEKQEINIKVLSQKEYEQLTDTATAVTSTGFCSQDLQYSPCVYLNDFVTQCSLCPSSCHVAHDENSLSFLKKDLKVQERRIDDVRQRPNFYTSKAMQDWFLVHHHNTSMLRELIRLMESKKLKAGSIIRLLAHKNEFRITNTQKECVTVQKLALPSPDKALAKVLADKSDNSFIAKELADVFALI